MTNGEEVQIDEDFKKNAKYILEGLRDLRGDMRELSRKMVEVQLSIAGKVETMEGLRRDFDKLQRKSEAQAEQITELQNASTALRVQIWMGAAIASALVSGAIKKLFG